MANLGNVIMHKATSNILVVEVTIDEGYAMFEGT